MPDISMCKNKDCPMRADCYRFIARPSYVQAYQPFNYKEDESCFIHCMVLRGMNDGFSSSLCTRCHCVISEGSFSKELLCDDCKGVLGL